MTPPQDCKRLAEVDFPIAEVSRHAVRDKATPPGHPATLHLWWARRPLASSRAMLLALLLPDPADPLCPEPFPAAARAILLAFPGRPDRWTADLQTNLGLRSGLLAFIADFADWNNAAHPAYLTAGRALVQAASPGDEPPLVVDPFAGGGSIPLEALRLGCDAFASDLNPVAGLLLKTLLEDLPARKPGLTGQLRQVVAEIRQQATQELAALYPPDPDGATPIAYLWARVVRCEAPHCGIEIPIYRSGWLAKKGAGQADHFRESPKGACVALLRENAAPGRPVQFRIACGEGRAGPAAGFSPLPGTKANGSNANVVCPACHSLLPGSRSNPRVVEQLRRQRGGADVIFDQKGQRVGGAILLAVVTSQPGQPGRHYRLPTPADYAAVYQAQQRMQTIAAEMSQVNGGQVNPFPDEELPAPGTLGFRVQRYGMAEWKDLFTARQNVALATLARHTANLAPGLPQTLTALLIGKMADGNNSLTRWRDDIASPETLFARQAIPIVWDFCEQTPASSARGAFLSGVAALCKVIDRLSAAGRGQTQPADATAHPLPDAAAGLWFTDPPYYDAIPYADLSDFFLVWLKRALPRHPLLRPYRQPCQPLSPKAGEAVQDALQFSAGQPKTAAWFEGKMAAAFAEGRRVLRADGIGSVVFAHKTTEGWEALLSGLSSGGWTITASWPVATEQPNRMRAHGSAALATSVHLVCRPRPADAPIGDWSQVLAELPGRVGDGMERLQAAGLRGADLVFACIGPALEIFSRYAAVETPAGHRVALPEYLEKVWEVVGRAALEQVLGTPEARARNGAVGVLEEDARLTALFLWTLQSSASPAGRNAAAAAPPADNAAATADDNHGDRPQRGYRLPYDVARRFAQPLGIHLDDWKSRIIAIDQGAVRLLPVTERAEQLFGSAGAATLAETMATAAAAPPQLELFPEPETPPRPRGRQNRPAAAAGTPGGLPARPSATTLDRVHAAMLFQHSGRSQALRALLQAEQDKGPDFLRLANALSALYPSGSREKRLLDAMLLAAPR